MAGKERMAEVIRQQRAPSKAKKILYQLLEGKQLTPEGLKWLFLALDPFHDTEIDPVGLPDGQCTRSLVQCIRKTTTITKPTSLSTGETWDCRVDITPFIQQWNATIGNASLNPGVVLTAGLAPSNLAGSARLTAGVSALKFKTGDPLGAGVTYESNYDLLLQATDDPRRVVAIAFEVENTTPELYKGGTVHYYRFPTTLDKKANYYTVGGALSQSAQIATGFPVALSDVVKDPNTETRKASEGAYVVGTFLDVDNQPFCGYQPGSVSLSQWTNNVPNQTVLWRQTLGLNPADNDLRLQGINHAGAWFTGLNENSTLTITVKYIIEDLVPISDNVYPLTRNTPPRDNLALEIYSQALAKVPVGVPVSENPLGEWFNTVMDAIANYAPKIGSVVPGLGSIIGSGVGALASAAGGINRSLAKAEKQKVKPAAKKTPPPVPPRPKPKDRKSVV